MPGRWKLIRLGAWTGVGALVAIVSAVLLFGTDRRETPQVGAGGSERRPLVAAFELIDHNGRPVTGQSFVDRPLAVFFGFTHCPDVCPTTLQDLSTLLAEVGPSGNRVQVLFISVDTERDTPEELAGYITAIDPSFVALTGSEQAVRQAADNFRVYYKRVEVAGSRSYSMDHTSTVFLMDRNHRFVGTIDLHESRTMSRAKLERLAAR